MSATSWKRRTADWPRVRCGVAERWQRGQVHQHIKRGDEEDGEQNGAGNGALGAADFAAEKADVVVAPVAVGGEQRGLGEAAQSSDLPERGERRRGGHVPAAGCRGVGESGDDDAGERGHDAGKQHPGHARDGADVAIEQRGDEKARGGGGEVGIVERGQRGDGRGVEAGPEDGEKSGETDAARSDGERRGEADLPDVEKAEPVSGAVGAVDLAEKCIRTTGAREGCAQLGPDQAVGDGDGGAEHPRPDGETIARGGDDQRQRDEGTDADHLQHVEEHGGAEADAALQSRGIVRAGIAIARRVPGGEVVGSRSGWEHEAAGIQITRARRKGP